MAAQQAAGSGGTRAVPNPARACPLCGGPNGCVPAARGDFASPCWCEGATFAENLLERVPLQSHGTACICARCAAVS